jgi:hypothetical protein
MNNKERIKDITDKVCAMLQQKNDDYGNSALEPINIFSHGNAVNSLRARIDDKLARIKNVGINDSTEDTLFDLCGYLVLLIIAEDNSKNLSHSSKFNEWTTTQT